MKCESVANGSIVELDEAAARQLIEAGIYKAVDEQPKPDTPPAKRRKART